MASFLTIVNGMISRLAAIAVSAGSADADKLVATDSAGQVDNSLVKWAAPGAIGATTPSTIKGTLFTGTGSSHVFGSTANTFNSVIIDGSATSNRQFVFQTAGATRWNFFANGAGGEPGSDGGSTFTLSYYTDGGVYKGDVFAARRSDGAFFVYSPTTFTGAIASKNIASTGTRIGLAPTSAPPGGGFRYDYTAGASVAFTSVGPSSNLQFSHGVAGVASSSIFNNGGSLALQWDASAATVQGNVLIGTGTNNAVDRLQVAGSAAFTGALKIADTTASVGPTTGAIVVSGGAGIAGAINNPGMQVTIAGALQTQGVGLGTVVGSVRGVGAVDLQTVRTIASQVASGSSATLLGGSGNTAPGLNSALSGGANNSTNGSYSSLSGGQLNAASSNFASVGGGTGNTASANAATIPGGQFAIANRPGQFSYSGGKFAVDGDAQYDLFVLRRQTIDATATELFLDGSGATSRITIANNSSLAYSICISAHSTTDRTKQAVFNRRGKIYKLTTAASTAILAGEIQENQVGALPWTATVSADITNGSLKISVVGDASNTINWVATVQAVEVTG